MPEKQVAQNGEWLPHFLPWLTTFALSIWAAVVQYIQKVRSGKKWIWRELFFDIVICSFVGLLTRFICDWANVYGPLSDLLIAISAHMGTRALVQYEALRNRILNVQDKGV